MHPTAFLDFALQGGGTSVPAAWSVFSQSVAALALTALWQGAAVALGLALCLRLAPRSPARHRFALWAGGFGVLVALQVLPLISRLIPVHLLAAGGPFAPAAAATTSHPFIQLSAAWSFVIAAFWLAASLYRAGDLAVHSLHLRKLWKTAIPVEIDAASLPRSVGRLSRPAVQICTTSDLERPSVIGFFAPRILIPDWLFLRLTPGELDQIVLHETEHLRRRDDWTNLLQKLCLVLFPLNPGLAWIERRLCREREMSCDDGVIRVTRAPRAYAACLASLAERGIERRAGMLSLGAWHARPELVRRVHSILRHKHGLNPLAARAVLGALGCILLAGAFTLSRCPRLVAFEPMGGAAAGKNPSAEPFTASLAISSTEPTSALNGREYASNTHSSSPPGLAAKNFTAQRSTSRELTAQGSTVQGSTAQDIMALKEHDFSRAENNAKASGALTPEGIAPRSIARVTNLDPAARALATTASRHSAASPQPATLATEDAGLRLGHVNALPAFRPDSSFIVMSTWESFEVTAPENCRKGAETQTAGCDEFVRVAGPSSALTAQRITPRITVTRMYLKIYSAGDKGSTWLVIQL